MLTFSPPLQRSRVDTRILPSYAMIFQCCLISDWHKTCWIAKNVEELVTSAKKYMSNESFKLFGMAIKHQNVIVLKMWQNQILKNASALWKVILCQNPWNCVTNALHHGICIRLLDPLNLVKNVYVEDVILQLLCEHT